MLDDSYLTSDDEQGKAGHGAHDRLLLLLPVHAERAIIPHRVTGLESLTASCMAQAAMYNDRVQDWDWDWEKDLRPTDGWRRWVKSVGNPVWPGRIHGARGGSSSSS